MNAPALPNYSLAWLLDVLERRGVLGPAVRRDIEVRTAQQRARLLKQHEGFSLGAGMARLRYNVSPAEIVASFGFVDPHGLEIDEDYLARLLAEEAGLEYRKIDPVQLDMALVTRTVSRPFALRHGVLPLASEPNGLLVAVENPFDADVTESLSRMVRGSLRRVVSSKHDILKAVVEIFGFRRSVESAARETKADTLYDFEQLVELRTAQEIEATDKHIVNAVDLLLAYAFDQRASDIHIEPRRGDSQVRLRIDGVLHDVHKIPRRVHAAMVARLKALSRMDIAERRRPQDGRIKTVLAGKEVELRVSTLPVAFGEKVVLRIFDPDTLLQDVQNLGFEPQELAIFQRWLGAPHGLVLITGPTGSGKTTTLYTALKTLADATVNVTSVEDPIEMVTDHFNQVAVQPRIGIDFASTLRTILRQDPDIIMVGEIRDAPTAEMAVQAALTGHLVFSTLHTNDSLAAVTRLSDLGVPRFLIASTLVGVAAQRLLRRICDSCKTIRPLSVDQLAALAIAESEAARYAEAAVGLGCAKCRGTGYRGRIGIFEMFDIDEPLRQVVGRGAGAEELLGVARRHQGYRPLRDAALARLAEGQTGFEEVVRVLGMGAV